MKFFDKWIEKQYHKRFKPVPFVVTTTKINTLKYMNCIMIPKEEEGFFKDETIKKELAKKCLDVVADNIEIRRREEPRMHLVIYEGLLEFVPRGDKDSKITFEDWRRQHEKS